MDIVWAIGNLYGGVGSLSQADDGLFMSAIQT